MPASLAGRFTGRTLAVVREQLDGRVPKQGLRQPQGAELAEFGEFLQHRLNVDGPSVILQGGQLGDSGPILVI